MALSFAVACAGAIPVAAAPEKVIVYGDSISLDTSERKALGWPNELDRLLTRRGGDWAVINHAINGNGMIWRTRCFGEPALTRLRSDRHAIVSTDIVVLMAGVNDVIQPRLPAGFSDCFGPAYLPASEIYGAFASLQQQLRAAGGPRVLLATIPPFSRSEFHSEAAERVRQDVNRWIRANWPARDVIDLDIILGGNAEARMLRADYDSGDGLHPNDQGAAAIAAAVAEQIR